MQFGFANKRTDKWYVLKQSLKNFSYKESHSIPLAEIRERKSGDNTNSLVFLNFSNLKMCGFQVPELRSQACMMLRNSELGYTFSHINRLTQDLKSMPLKIAMSKNDFTFDSKMSYCISLSFEQERDELYTK